MSTNPQNQNPNWNQQSQYPNQQGNVDNFPNDPHAVRGVPPFRPGGVLLTPNGYVITRTIKYQTIARRAWSTAAMILTIVNGLGALILLGSYDPFIGWMALISTVVLAIGTGVVHMLESIVAELRRIG